VGILTAFVSKKTLKQKSPSEVEGGKGRKIGIFRKGQTNGKKTARARNPRSKTKLPTKKRPRQYWGNKNAGGGGAKKRKEEKMDKTTAHSDQLDPDAKESKNTYGPWTTNQ